MDLWYSCNETTQSIIDIECDKSDDGSIDGSVNIYQFIYKYVHIMGIYVDDKIL